MPAKTKTRKPSPDQIRKLIHRYEMPQYLDALSWFQKQAKAGYVHPDALAGKSDQAKQRFWSGKEINLSSRHPFQVLILLGVFVYSLAMFSYMILFLFAFVYMFSGIFARAAYSWQRGRQAGSSPVSNPTTTTPE